MSNSSFVFNNRNLSNPNYQGKIEDYHDLSDPNYFGPGLWLDIHQVAFAAQDLTTQKQFKKKMKFRCNKLPCEKCRKHALEYLVNHPIRDYIGIVYEDDRGNRLSIGPFIWSWKFHNSVNARLKKPIMQWETAFKLYSSEKLKCNNACSIDN